MAVAELNVIVLFMPGLLPASVSALRSEFRSDVIAKPPRNTVLSLTAQLMPTAEQLREAEAVVERYRNEIGHRCKIYFVVPDYFETRPKRCMNGWGSVFLGVAPDGAALPCHTARSLPGLTFPNVKDSSVREIWYESDAFNRFRGFDWMKEPCRSCEEKGIDAGGCR